MHLGKGIYTLQEAAGLVRVNPARLTRWIGGYRRNDVDYEPLWQSELASESEDNLLISFADLMEVRVILAFSNHGVKIQTVRKAIKKAKQEYGLERPFATQKFQTDGQRIFVSLQDIDEDDSGYMEIVSSQKSFKAVVHPTLKDLDFEAESPIRWWPLGKKKTVVVDPERSFGKPIDRESGVPIEAIVKALDGNKIEISEIKRVAKLFDLPQKSVRQAAFFEREYAA